MTDTATAQAPETTIVDNRIRERREALGLGRSGLAELTGLTSAKIWRIEGGRPNGDELQVVNAMLDNLETNGLPEHMQPRRKPTEPKVRRRTRADLEMMVAHVNALIVESHGLKTARELKDAIERIRTIVDPETEVATATVDA